MGLLYRVLGIFAGFGDWGNRYRLNLIPASWWIAVAAGAVFAVGVVHIREDARNGELPQTTSVHRLLNERPPTDTYVSVRGLMAPQAALTEREGERAVGAWIPMVDVGGQRLLLVHARTTDQFGDRPTEMAVTGMLRAMDEDLRRHVERNPIDRGFRPEVAFVLMPGQRPRSAEFGLALCAATGIPLAFFLAAVRKRNLIFQSGGSLQAAPLEDHEPVDMRASARGLLEIPSVLGELEDGQVAVFADLGAGWWSLPLDPVGHLEPGWLYLGFAKRPAVRFESAGQTLVLSFANERQRAWLAGSLSH